MKKNTIIKDSIIKNNSLIKYEIPQELTDDEDIKYIISANKYKL